MEKITLAFSLAFLLLMAGLSLVAYAMRRAEVHESESDVLANREDMEPVNYKDIMDCERPFIENQFN